MHPNSPAFLRLLIRQGWKQLTITVVLATMLTAFGIYRGSVDAQNVDYIGASTGARLDLGFPVLVPSWVPSPFGGEPAVDGGGGSYSLYWMNAGGEPTFLQITGVVGGGLPTGSPYDLNNELSVNASVNGVDAIHDVTPIYDAVWWIQGGVLYSVQSRNMTGSDSLSLANSLIQFVPPAEPAPEAPLPTPVVSEGTGGNADQPSNRDNAGSSASGANAGQSQGSGTNTPSADAGSGTSSNEQSAESETTVPPSAVGSDGTGDPFMWSDGTGGAPASVVPGDGTGGGVVIIIASNGLPPYSPIP